MMEKCETVIAEKAELVPFVVKIFVTFETETAQRRALNDLTIGTLPALLNKSASITPDKQFRFSNVLAVQEAPEPSEILYAGMHVPLVKRVKSFIRGVALGASFPRGPPPPSLVRSPALPPPSSLQPSLSSSSRQT